MTDTPLSPLSDDDIDAGAATDAVPLSDHDEGDWDTGRTIGPDTGGGQDVEGGGGHDVDQGFGEADGVETGAV